MSCHGMPAPYLEKIVTLVVIVSKKKGLHQSSKQHGAREVVKSCALCACVVISGRQTLRVIRLKFADVM